MTGTELGPNGENWPTHSVALWITNDEPYYWEAKKRAEASDIDGLRKYLTKALKEAKEPSAAWYTAQDLSPNDYDRIDWEAVAGDLVGE